MKNNSKCMFRQITGKSISSKKNCNKMETTEWAVVMLQFSSQIAMSELEVPPTQN